MVKDMKEDSMEHDQEVIPTNTISRTQTQATADFASTHQIDDPNKFSDGWSKRAMFVLFGSFLGMIGSLGFVNSGGVIQTYLLQNTLQNIPSSTVGWIFSVYNFFAFGMTLISGPIFDKIGCKIPIAFGIVVMMIGLILTSFCKEVYQFILSYGIVTGLGAAFTFGPFISCLSHYFLKKRALAIGASYTGGGIGGVVLPLIFRSLFGKVGFGWTIRIGAFICLFFLVVGWLFVHDRHEEFKEHSDESIFKQIIGSVDFKILFHHVLFSVIVFGLLFNGLAFLITLVVISSYSTSRGFTDSESYLLVVVFNSFSIPGRIIPSYLADNQFGRFNTFCMINTFSLIAFTVIWLPFGHHLTALFVFAACFGFSSGSVLSLSASLVASIIPTKEIGKGLGTAFFILSIGDLFAIPIAGAITNAGTKKSYDNLVVFLTCCAGVGWIISFVARYLYGGFNLKRV